MNFRDFLDKRSEILKAPAGDLLDLSETNLAKSVKHLLPHPLSLPAKAHRCHLAEWWLEVMGLPPAWKARALVSKGVRHSLELMCQRWAAQGKRVLFPADVYPVYFDISKKAGLSPARYDSSPLMPMELPPAHVLLLANPLKPRGVLLTKEELGAVIVWLGEDHTRRVVVDAVYTMDGGFDQVTRALQTTGQAIILHSLSKAWATPLVMGVALVPERDIDEWTPVFRQASPEQSNLQIAQALLTAHREVPHILQCELRAAGEACLNALAARGVTPLPGSAVLARYHFLIDQPWGVLLREKHILGVPLSVFGSEWEDMTVVTSLAFISPKESK